MKSKKHFIITSYKQFLQNKGPIDKRIKNVVLEPECKPKEVLISDINNIRQRINTWKPEERGKNVCFTIATQKCFLDALKQDIKRYSDELNETFTELQDAKDYINYLTHVLIQSGFIFEMNEDSDELE